MRKNNLFKKTVAAGLVLLMTASLAACDGKKTDTKTEDKKTETKADKEEDVELQVFIAASLNTAMTDIAERYEKEHPNVKIVYNADSSGTLLTQIEEGYECDLFFSAAQKQMDQLEADGLVVEGTRHNVVNNQVVVITLKDSDTAVTGLENLNEAKSIALAGGSVPVGKYTRQALMNLGILDKVDDASTITTEQVSEALGGAEISEQANVSKVLIAVTEGACEVGTTYYSDTYGYEDQIKILQTVSYDLTGNVIYPICRVENKEADDAKKKAADDFLAYVTSDDAKKIFDSYYFDTNVESKRNDMEEIRQILAGLDWSPLFISIKTGIAATIVSFFLGIWAARKVLKAKTGLRAVLDGILTLPLVLPPTVAGFFLLLIFSTRRTVGSCLYTTFDIKIVQSWAGCVIAATVIAFPLMYRNARAAFEQVDVNLIYAAQTLGMPEWKIFWRVIMPAAGPGVASGTILAFARALGEYGATSMLAGNIPGKTATISQRIAMVIQDGDYQTAGVWVGIVILIAFGIVVLMNLAFGKGMKHTKQW